MKHCTCIAKGGPLKQCNPCRCCCCLVLGPIVTQLACPAQAQGGDLVKLGSGVKQRDIEAYFTRRGALDAFYYWHGVRREALGAELQFVSDGSPVQVRAAELCLAPALLPSDARERPSGW